MSTVASKLLTAEEFFQLPMPKDGSKQELVHGEVIVMTRPGFEHGEIQINIGSLIKEFLRKHRIGRVVSERGVGRRRQTVVLPAV